MLNPPFIGVPWELPKGGVYNATHSTSNTSAWALVRHPYFQLKTDLNVFIGCSVLRVEDRLADLDHTFLVDSFVVDDDALHKRRG